jgi:hypothetical protein
MVAKKENKKSGLFGVCLIAPIMVWLGGLAGFLYLTAFPAKPFSSMREYEAARVEADSSELPKPSDAFYIKGPTLASRSWEAKRRSLSETGPQAVTLSAGEINAWMDGRFSSVIPTANAKESKMLVVPGVPNFAVVEERGLYLNLPLTVVLFGSKYDCMLITLGTVSENGFEVSSVSLNGAAIPLPGLVGASILQSLAQAFQSTEDYGIVAAAFERAESVTMESGAVVFRLR